VMVISEGQVFEGGRGPNVLNLRRALCEIALCCRGRVYSECRLMMDEDAGTHGHRHLGKHMFAAPAPVGGPGGPAPPPTERALVITVSAGVSGHSG